MKQNISDLTINNIRMLGIEMITNANSGHPGIVLGAAPIVYALFKNHLNIYHKDLNYFNRDRFILSAGHGSALLYSIMYIAGYSSINLEDIKLFRQLNSKTSGHPESHLLSGVDIGTGPLGQGAASSVGFAIAESYLSQRFKGVIDHYTYCLLGDGCMEEGVTHEALAIAGRYQLKKLIWLYDSNNVQLDGNVSDSTITNYAEVVKANNWDYVLVKDGMNWKKIDEAIKKAKKNNKPTFIEIKTNIGYASNVENSCKAHGSPLKQEQIDEIKKKLNYSYKSFTVLKSSKNDFNVMKDRGIKHYKNYQKRLSILKINNKPLYTKLIKFINNEFDLEINDLNTFKNCTKEATRNLFGTIFEKISSLNENILVINNDLSGSTKVKASNSNIYDVGQYDKQNINIGVREFLGVCLAMGITKHGGVKAITSTFLSFADYCKAGIRLSAINQTPCICVFSHDSITVGEDGPTHQPVEQLTMLRSIPNVLTFRPSNINEIYYSLKYALISKNEPINIITSRSSFFQKKGCTEKQFKNGYYYVQKNKNAKLNLIATGSEVGLCLEIANLLKIKNILVNVISVTSMEFLRNNINEFKKTILVNNIKSVAIEMGSTYMWYQFVDVVFGVNEYGKSANPDDVVKYFEMDSINLSKKIEKLIK